MHSLSFLTPQELEEGNDYMDHEEYEEPLKSFKNVVMTVRAIGGKKDLKKGLKVVTDMAKCEYHSEDDNMENHNMLKLLKMAGGNLKKEGGDIALKKGLDWMKDLLLGDV